MMTWAKLLQPDMRVAAYFGSCADVVVVPRLYYAEEVTDFLFVTPEPSHPAAVGSFVGAFEGGKYLQAEKFLDSFASQLKGLGFAVLSEERVSPTLVKIVFQGKKTKSSYQRTRPATLWVLPNTTDGMVAEANSFPGTKLVPAQVEILVVKGYHPVPAVVVQLQNVRKEYGYANSKPCRMIPSAAFVYVEWDPGQPNADDYNGNDFCNACHRILCDWNPHSKWRTGRIPAPVCVDCASEGAKQFGYM